MIYRMNPLVPLISLTLLSVCLFFGCGQGGRKMTSADAKAFDNAAPELKESWQKAQSAGATNDYVVAILTLRSMLPRGLSKPQIDAVQNAISTYDGKMMKAVDRGDPAAQKALEILRSPAAQMGR